MKSVFERLSAINVNDHVEKKKDLTYLSWAWAWSETKKACPDASYRIKETEYDPQLGFMCHTEVTIENETLEMWLPVMDGANKSMKKESYTYETRFGQKVVDAATTFDINKTIMRCLVKNLAMFGLGIYIYAGEDLPENEVTPIAPTKAAKTPSKKAATTTEPEVKLPELKKNTVEFSKVVKYVVDNKEMGFDKLTQQIQRKYTLTTEIILELEKLFKI